MTDHKPLTEADLTRTFQQHVNDFIDGAKEGGTRAEIAAFRKGWHARDAEADLARTVALREAAESIATVPYAATTKEYVNAILSLRTQSAADALDAYVAEAVLAESEWFIATMNRSPKYDEAPFGERLVANRAKVKGGPAPDAGKEKS